MRCKDMKILVDDYFVNTRIINCDNIDCKYNELNNPTSNDEIKQGCILKYVALDKLGKCAKFEQVKEEDRKAFRLGDSKKYG